MRHSSDDATLVPALINRQVRLSGTPSSLDPRQHVYRPDLADIGLADQIAAAHYATPVQLVCFRDRTGMHARPAATSTAVSELVFGEAFAAFEISGGWAWGQSLHDGYVGYVADSALSPAGAIPTHQISAAEALIFSMPDIKAPLVTTMPLNARIAVTGLSGSFHDVGDLGFVHDRHISPLGTLRDDPVVVAGDFIGTPYLWGGRTRRGIDCSGLVQGALMACGFACPRDTDQQRISLGSAVDPSDIQRGDIVFFPGHVGLMASATDLLHANAYWMSTVTEPLADVTGRLRPDHAEPIVAVRRLTLA